MHTTLSTRVRWLAADAQYCPCCTSAWLIPSTFFAPLAWLCRCAATTGNIKVAFCRSLKVQVHFQLAARSMLHGSACASHARGSTLPACRCVQEGSSRGRAGRPFSVRKWRFGVENGSERRLRRGRSRPRGLVVTLCSGGRGCFFDVGC